MKKSELLKTDHHIQLNWLDNQIAKTTDGKNDSFFDLKVAVRAYEKLKKNLIPSEHEIEHFMDVQLSDNGLRRLVTAMRVYQKRCNAERLQVEITQLNKAKLDELVLLSGKTKIEIINALISTANIEDFKNSNK
ncbi:hypothetical protein [Psychromonas aquatilis]|uniref:Uncharacterized protein n=1 Tax=Psychromonas aquatilis TaxID=2005072 RepID=A0ABU9GTT8_9GAMM